MTKNQVKVLKAKVKRQVGAVKVYTVNKYGVVEFIK